MLRGKIGIKNLDLTAMSIHIVFTQVSDTFQGERAQKKDQGGSKLVGDYKNKGRRETHRRR